MTSEAPSHPDPPTSTTTSPIPKLILRLEGTSRPLDPWPRYSCMDLWPLLHLMKYRYPKLSLETTSILMHCSVGVSQVTAMWPRRFVNLSCMDAMAMVSASSVGTANATQDSMDQTVQCSPPSTSSTHPSTQLPLAWYPKNSSSFNSLSHSLKTLCTSNPPSLCMPWWGALMCQPGSTTTQSLWAQISA